MISNFIRDLKENRGALIGLFVCRILYSNLDLWPLLAPFSPSELTDNLTLGPFWTERFCFFKYSWNR